MSVKLMPAQRGDTIVEVLVAIAVAASVLAITYATMNRNLLSTQNTQERVQAAKLTQAQIEALRSLKTTNPAQLAAAAAGGMNFCIKDDGTPTASWGGPLSNFGPYAPECVKQQFYHIAINTSNNLDYKFYIQWDRIGGGSREYLYMIYRK